MEDKEKIVIIINGKGIKLTTLTSHIISQKYKDVFKSHLVNIDKLPNDIKATILFDLVKLEANSACVMYDDEVIEETKGARQLHNNLFNRINMVYNVINFKTKSGQDIQEYQIKKFPELLVDIGDYVKTIEKLYDDKTKKI